jgi:small subunit ribosomal protein S2e
MWRGYWKDKVAKSYNVPGKVTGHCGSMLVHLIPTCRDTHILSILVPKKLPMMASIADCMH